MTRPHIVMATIAAGGGHVATARAMAQAVEAHAPDAFELTVTDLMHDLGWTAFDARHKAQWRWMLERPWTARAGQRLIDAFPAVTRRVLRHSFDAFAGAVALHFSSLRPDLIVANHGFLTWSLTQARRRHGLRAPVLTFATEPLDASALWAESEADAFVVPSRPARDDLIRLGVPADKIDVIGYPVQRAFLNPPPRAVARARLGLDDRFTCLVSLGGEGVGGRVESVVAGLLEGPQPPQVVVMTGRNESLAAALRARETDGLVVRPYVESMADHLAASDLVIGKAGPSSVMEALAVGRPVLVTSCAGLNELAVLRFLVDEGLGHDAADLADLRRHVDAYRASPDAALAVEAACRALDFAGMTARLGHYLAVAAGHGLAAARGSQQGLA